MNWIQYRLAVDNDAISDRTEYDVLRALIDFANDQGEAWPGVEKIARRARLSVDEKGKSRATETALKGLETAGHISRKAGGGGRNKTTIYKVHVQIKTPHMDTQTPQEMRGIEELNPAFDDTETPHMDTRNLDKPRISLHAYKGEVPINRNEEVNEGDVSARPAPPTSRPTIAPFFRDSKLDDPAFKTFQQITGWLHGARSPDQNRQLTKAWDGMLEKVIPPATSENLLRFAELWAALDRTKPTPGQVFQAWEDTFNPPIKRESNDRISTQSTTNAHLTPRQRIAKNRREFLEQLAEH